MQASGLIYTSLHQKVKIDAKELPTVVSINPRISTIIWAYIGWVFVVIPSLVGRILLLHSFLAG